MLPNIGIPELILILAVIVVILGPGKLPELGKALGRMVKEYRKEANRGLPPPKSRRELREEREKAAREQAAAAARAAAPDPSTDYVADPARRGVFTGVLRVFQLVWKIWRWRRGLP
ncbi:twin-arginine translocase TatA/TatE family subunit [Candidatus Desulforudis audaxviator]|uniref:Sec-independent protein translocase protein TatA n=1 Tax=Desulforudis audaxviator (strain MP104C) TaxID=477974 RepID=B1I3M9_DESAP|nr:twin-arginine translocase TatA/TatE family subunit [Candidatus Desulforudis audaxviator]ACA59628.1 sec-independent translocation protein mttA/Hcf106 [Candidatus Desulforudis audaxviator MP104C]AZK59618.1 Twin-arginine translocation protein TatAd [Candidatus Desulforudis audaxviator]